MISVRQCRASVCSRRAQSKNHAKQRTTHARLLQFVTICGDAATVCYNLRRRCYSLLQSATTLLQSVTICGDAATVCCRGASLPSRALFPGSLREFAQLCYDFGLSNTAGSAFASKKPGKARAPAESADSEKPGKARTPAENFLRCERAPAEKNSLLRARAEQASFASPSCEPPGRSHMISVRQCRASVCSPGRAQTC